MSAVAVPKPQHIDPADAKRIAKRATKRGKIDKAPKYDPFRSAIVFDAVTCNYIVGQSPVTATAAATAPAPVAAASVPSQPSWVAKVVPPSDTNTDTAPAQAPSQALDSTTSPTDGKPSGGLVDASMKAMQLDQICLQRMQRSSVRPLMCVRCDGETKGYGQPLLGHAAYIYRVHWRDVSSGTLPQCDGCGGNLTVMQQNFEGIPVFACFDCQNESLAVIYANSNGRRPRLLHYDTCALARHAEFRFDISSRIVCIPSLMQHCPMCLSAEAPFFCGMTSARVAKRVLAHYAPPAAGLKK